MKIKTNIFEEVIVWQDNTIIVDVDSEQHFKQLIRDGALLCGANNVEYVCSEFIFEALRDTGNFEYQEEYEILDEE